MKAFLSILLAYCCIARTQAQECLRTLDSVFESEQNAVGNLDVKRTYILCPNTRFEPGVLEESSGEIVGGEFPVVLLRNAHLKCGNDGRSENNCVIDGTGTYAMFLTPYSLFALENAENIIVQGITVDFWVRGGQTPIIIASPFGDITFLDCIFSNNLADPLFFIDEVLFTDPGLGPSGRAGAIYGGSKKPVPGDPDFEHFDFNFDTGDDALGMTNGTGPLRRRGRRLSIDGTTDDSDGSVDIFSNETEHTRSLQVASFRVTFQGCLFDFNSPVRNARTQAGLSVIRFRARNDPLNQNVPFEEYVGKMDARFIRNTFRENIFSFSGDRAVYRSLIDFYSLGRLVLRQNCFLDSPVKTFGVVTTFSGATIVNDRNFISPQQTSLECTFISKLDVNYDPQQCGGQAKAPACRANTPTRAPSQAPVSSGGGFSGGGGFCFPGDARCEVEGQGEVAMQDVKLGDKVLVEGGKYEPVYSFGHYDNQTQTEYLRFITTGPPLEISVEHMLFVPGGRAVPAGTVKVGDTLELADGNQVTVRKIRSVTKKGAYAPFTPSGTIIVNDLKASSFVAFQDSSTLKIAGYDTGVSFQFCAHAFEAPHRFWCKYLSSCTSEDYTAEGLSLWVANGHKLFLWFFSLHPLAMFLLFLPTVTIFTILTYPMASLLTLGAIVAVSCREVRITSKKTAASFV